MGPDDLPARPEVHEEVVHRVGDLAIDRRSDLRTVGPVDLDPVVTGRVVAGRHDHPGRGIQVPHSECGQWGRRRPGDRHRIEATGAQGIGDLCRELPRATPGIVGDHDGSHGVGSGLLHEHPRRRQGGDRRHESVHPVGTDPDGRPQAGCSEVQSSIEEPVDGAPVLLVDEGEQPGAVIGVGVGRVPPAGPIHRRCPVPR